MSKEYIEREAALYVACDKNAAWDAYRKIKAIPAADVVEAGYKAFAEWVARIIFNGGLEDEAFCELACRKLNDLGIVEKTENEWHFDDPLSNDIKSIIENGELRGKND